MSYAQKHIGANIGFGSIDVRYEQKWQAANNSVAEANLKDAAHLTGWKAEKLSMQVVVRAKAALSGLKIVAGSLKLAGDSNNKGRMIAGSAVKTGFIVYVLSNGIGSSGSGCGIEPAVQKIANIVADGIEYGTQKEVAAGSTQPIWVTLQIPENAVAGTYKGQLTLSYQIKGSGTQEQQVSLPYEVEVKNKTLAAPKDWAFHLDLWQYPGAVARINQVTPWSSEHFEKMRPYMKMLAAAGQKVITTSIMEDPWNGQTYDKYESMVQWIKEKDGKWRYDYTIFDKWVSFMMKMGIDQQINCYSMVPWNNTFSYQDEATGTKKVLVAKPGTEQYTQFWRPMLEDFARHLKEKGWFGITTIAMDERPLEAMEKVIKLVKTLPQPFKMSLAGSYHASLDKDIYDYSITTGEKYDSEVLDRRLKAGLPTTYYTCCSEAYPNTFSFSPPAEAAFIPLLAAKRHLTGYLRWAYNAWPSSPKTDARFGSWSSGDTYLVYPGPGSSIRFEQLIRGIQDFQKIAQLRKMLVAKNATEDLAKLEDILASCSLSVMKTAGASNVVSKVENYLNNQ